MKLEGFLYSAPGCKFANKLSDPAFENILSCIDPCKLFCFFIIFLLSAVLNCNEYRHIYRKTCDVVR